MIVMMKRSAIYLCLGLVSLAWIVGGSLTPDARADSKGGKRIAKQMTVVSITDPIPGHAAHQMAMLLPPVKGQTYQGVVTYTASKPVEVVVFHEYHAEKEPDAEHGSVLIGLIDGKPYAISVMQFTNNVAATNSATVAFTGNAVALHTLSGDKFSATASVHAVQEKNAP